MLRKHVLKGVALVALVWASVTVQSCYTRVRVPAHPRVRAHPVEARPLRHRVGLDLFLSVEPVKFRIGDPVDLMITVYNPHPRHVEFLFPSGCNVDYEVRNSWGKVVGPFRACNAFGSSIDLDAHETLVFERHWPNDGRYFTSADKLVPGRYWITAGYVWGLSYEAATDAVMIEVMPPAR